MQIQVGVIGLGYWGPNLVRNLRALPDCGVRTVCDLDEKRLAHLRSLFPEVGGTTSHREVI